LVVLSQAVAAQVEISTEAREQAQAVQEVAAMAVITVLAAQEQ
jgi:hypothetical protein